MPSLFNRDGRFYAQFDDAGRIPKRKRLSFGTNDKRLALKLLRRAEEAYRLGRFDPWVDRLSSLEPERPVAPVSVAQAAKRYIADRCGVLRPTTVVDRESVLRRLGESVGADVPVARLRCEDLEPFCLSAEVAESTRRKRVAYARIWLDWCAREGIVTENVGLALRTPRKTSLEHAIVRKAASVEEVDLIAEAAIREGHAWKGRMYRFCFYTGLRVSEAARLRWSEVDIGGRTVTLTEQKNGRATVLPISLPATNVLLSAGPQPASTHVFRSPRQRKPVRNVRAFCASAAKDFRHFRIAAGIPRNLTFHGLRHGFATHLAEHGASAWTIKEACRHSSVSVSQVYVRMSASTLARQIDEVFGHDSGTPEDELGRDR